MIIQCEKEVCVSTAVNGLLKDNIQTNIIMADGTIKQDLKSSLDYFQHMLDIIPPRIYFSKQNQDNLEQKDSGIYTTADTAIYKQAKFDPTKIKTVTQLQGNSNDNDKDEIPVGKNKKKKKKGKKQNADKGSVKKEATEPDVLADSRYGDLQQKLRAKLEALRGNRKDSQEWLEKKKLQRKESSLKAKKKKTSKQNKKEKESAVIPPNGLIASKSTPTKPVFNREGKLVFSKFDFIDKGIPGTDKTKNLGKDYKKLLANLEKDKEKVEQLKEKNPEKAKLFEEKSKWRSVIDKAEGVKVRDDPELLKKAVKRKEKGKKKSEKLWKERQETLQEKMDRKQNRRKKNIKSRKEAKIKGKVQKGKKKGHVIPGF